MKANAPEKLYVDVHNNLSDSILYGFTEKRTDDDIEYTRTDTLEVKEVDLKKELDYDDYMNFFEEHPNYSNGDWGFDECWVFAKYFFELGLKAKENLKVKEVEEEPVSNDLEEAANTYVDNWYKLNNLDKESYPIDVEISKNDFKAGAKWHKEQMIDKACNYLFSHMGLFATFFDDDIVEDIERSEFIKKFRIAMEENK